jgi:hypothetical protein
MFFWISLYFFIGWAVGLIFYLWFDSILREHPDKYGNRSISELIQSSAIRNSQEINVITSSIIVHLFLWIALILFWKEEDKIEQRKDKLN